MWEPQKTINNKYGRIVALIDMDCFYCQVEEQLNPSLKGKPIIVQPLQYDDYGGGGCIAINYVAKARGVTRSMRGDEAKKICSDLELVRVPVVRGKADLSKYRNAGKQVAAVLQTFTPLMTRASVDEAYLDLTERVNSRLSDMNSGKYSLHPDALTNTFAVGYRAIGEYVQHVTNKVTRVSDDDDENLEDASEDDLEDIRKSDIKLLIASSIVNEIRATVKEKTGYECSAGIAHNKILAKIVCGLNKPNKQTLLPIKQIPEFYRKLPIKKVQGLDRKLGDRICTELNVQYMAEMLQFSREELQQRFDEKNGQWLYNLARGIDLQNIVKPRLVPKSISCSKMFPRHNAITELTKLRHWLHEIVKDVVERIEEDELDNNRRAKQMVVSFSQTINNADVSSSRTVNISVIDEEKIVNDAINVIKKNTTKFFKSDNGNTLNNPIKYLGFNVNKFEDFSKQNRTIGALFAKGQKKEAKSERELKNSIADQEESRMTFTENIDENSVLPSKFQVEFREDVSTDEESVEENDLIANETIKMVQNEISSSVGDRTSESSAPSTSITANYMQEYAEFYKPLEIEKVKCDQCGKMISASEVQVHADEHLAFQMNQEQRAEFQQQLKRANDSSSKTPIKKKQKIDSHKKAETSSIKKFFSIVDEIYRGRERTPEPTTSEDSTQCTECVKVIPITELFEHMDFHAAKRLQDELLKTEINANRQMSNNNNNSKSLNKTKKSKKTVEKKNPAVRNITAFFQSTG